LKTRELTAEGTLVSETHFTKFSLDPPEREFFTPPEETPVEEITRETLSGPEALPPTGLNGVPWRTDLPSGHRMDLAALLPIGKKEKAVHFRYVDGLSVLSLFVSPLPIEGSPNTPVDATGHDDPTFSFPSLVGNILTWEEDGRYFLLIGNMEKDGLEELRRFLMEEPAREEGN
jgi:hypothetical protein